MSPASPRSGPEWTSRLLAITMMAVIAPFSLAQPSLHGELGFGADLAASSTWRRATHSTRSVST